MSLGPAVAGLLSGHMRFLSAFVERQHGVDPRDIGLVLGPTLGVTGVLSGFAAGHLIDHCFNKWRTLKVNLCLGYPGISSEMSGRWSETGWICSAVRCQVG